MTRTRFSKRRARPPTQVLCRTRAVQRTPLEVEQLEDRCLLSTLTVNGSQQLQTIDGFGTNLSSEAWNNGAIAPSLDILLNHGYKLFRVIVEPVQGWEDTNPNTGQYSNANPNWPYYNNLYGTSTKFTNLWNTISYLNNHGATVWLNLQSDAPAWMTDSGGSKGSMGQDHEADWATMVSTMVDYAVNTAHVRIDSLAPMNEPDNGGDPVQGPQVGATQYVRMLDTLETQLQGYGLGNIPLIGPDAQSANTAASTYIPAMLADSFLMPHMMQFGFHTYGGTAYDPSLTNNSTYPGRHILSDEYDGAYFNEDQGIRATPSQLWTQADQSFQNLMTMIGIGENGALIWDGVDNFYEYYQQWSAHGLISYDWTAPDPTAQSDYGTTPRLYANAQMFQFVAPGSVVIGSSTSAGNFLELAFKGPNGQVTIVGENTGSSTQSITGTLSGGLNVSLFNMYFTNSSLNEQQQANVAVSNNTFSFSVPADTIFTLTTQTAPSVTSVTPSSGLTTGGQSVTINGSSFTGAIGVFFGGVAATSFTVNSDSKITAVVPAASAAGGVDVTVANAIATSAISTADQFQYVNVNGSAPPTLANAAAAALAGNQASALLSVLGASQYPASTLTYLWATIGTPPAPVTFSTNGDNGASNVTATFSQTGSYNFLVTITDPAGNSVTSNVAVTVNQVPTSLTVSPASGTVLPNATLQFTATASDQFGNPYTTAPTWALTGGGVIDATGKFTAGAVGGGPFTVTASAGGLNATASVTVSSNINLAPTGTAYRWFALSSSTSNSNRTAAPGLNDNNLTTDVILTGGNDDVTNAYEAAGVIWSASKSVSKVTFTNGSFNAASYDGVFDNSFSLQTTTDGSTWTNISTWSLSPTYKYNLAAAAGLTYAFAGTALSVLGVRVIGRVHSVSSGNDSWFAAATEVQAFAVASNPSPAVTSLNLNAGPLAGGTSVSITGSNFTGATAVSFAGIPATSFTVNSATQISAIAPPASVPGSVDVTVTTAYGTSPTSAADQFTYIAPPAISLQPANRTVNVGQSASFTVSASGTGALTYQWQKLVNSIWTNINGASSATFTINAAALTDAASYCVIVTNAGGSTTSNPATLTVNIPIPAAPAGLSTTPGNNQVSLSWSASTGATGYLIYRGTASGGETLLASPTGTATIYVDSAANNGTRYYYQVTAANSSGESPRSTEVFATPQLPIPAVTSLNPNTGPLAGGTSVSITGSNFTGATAVSFAGIPATSFTVNSATQITAIAPPASVPGSVDVTVTTAYGTSPTSAADQFTYISPPAISLQPANRTVNVGQSASFTVSASGTGALTYQWQKLINSTWTNINGATSATFTINAAALTDAASYWVIVTNVGGSTISNPATLTVNIPIPAAPAGLSTTPGNNQVSLSWSASTGATGYLIYRGTASGGETLLASPTGTATTYIDTAANNGTRYYYQVTAVNAGGESSRSAEVSATPQAPVSTPLSIWSSSTVPAVQSYADSSAVEVGVKFTSDVAGTITGLRFYKGTGNTGTHTGHLWSSTGTLLASATFTAESSTGWQSVLFATPVVIAPNTVYVASYFAPNGHYAADSGYFTNKSASNGPLHALQNGASGGNGVYRYGSTSGFPSSSYLGANYWVDVLFTPTVLAVSSETPAPRAVNVPVAATVTVTFNVAINSASLSLVLRNASNQIVPATVTYNTTTHVATLTPTSSLLIGSAYSVTVSAADPLGNIMNPFTWTFST